MKTVLGQTDPILGEAQLWNNYRGLSWLAMIGIVLGSISLLQGMNVGLHEGFGPLNIASMLVCSMAIVAGAATYGPCRRAASRRIAFDKEGVVQTQRSLTLRQDWGDIEIVHFTPQNRAIEKSTTGVELVSAEGSIRFSILDDADLVLTRIKDRCLNATVVDDLTETVEPPIDCSEGRRRRRLAEFFATAGGRWRRRAMRYRLFCPGLAVVGYFMACSGKPLTEFFSMGCVPVIGACLVIASRCARRGRLMAARAAGAQSPQDPDLST